MLNAIACQSLIAVLVAAALAGCDVEGASRAQSPPGVEWRLTRDGVAAVDAASGKINAQIALPGWVWVKDAYACAPVVARGPQGEAVITSNVTSTLWRVDPRSFQVSVHELAGVEDRGIEFGFSGLAYSAEQGAFFAVGTVPNSVWRIDPELRRAQKISVSEPIQPRCGEAPRVVAHKPSRVVSLCIAGTTLNLAADQRTGYVNGRPC